MPFQKSWGGMSTDGGTLLRPLDEFMRSHAPPTVEELLVRSGKNRSRPALTVPLPARWIVPVHPRQRASHE